MSPQEGVHSISGKTWLLGSTRIFLELWRDRWGAIFPHLGYSLIPDIDPSSRSRPRPHPVLGSWYSILVIFSSKWSALNLSHLHPSPLTSLQFRLDSCNSNKLLRVRSAILSNRSSALPYLTQAVSSLQNSWLLSPTWNVCSWLLWNHVLCPSLASFLLISFFFFLRGGNRHLPLNSTSQSWNLQHSELASLFFFSPPLFILSSYFCLQLRMCHLHLHVYTNLKLVQIRAFDCLPLLLPIHSFLRLLHLNNGLSHQ